MDEFSVTAYFFIQKQMPLISCRNVTNTAVGGERHYPMHDITQV